MVEYVVMNSRGMITIPANIRKKYKFKEGSRFIILELDDQLTIIPIQSEAEFWSDLIPHDVLEESMEDDREAELKLENHSK